MTKFDFINFEKNLIGFDFKRLFVEVLGWNLPAQQQPYSVMDGDDTWLLDVVAHKKGVQILHCRSGGGGSLPDYATRQKIERKITQEVREHLIVFTDAAQTTQIWQWVTRVQAKTAQYREVNFRKGEVPELLTQKLSRLYFTLDEEELLTVLGVAQRLDDAAPREKVTKKFYGEFEKQRKAFAAFIEGIPVTSEDQRWYTAVLIDRLMFLWFLQEKSFLDGKKDYLQARLREHLETQSTVSFYKSFLAPLFFSAFAEERTETNRTGIEAAFGSVPYLNGGLFAQHQLEQHYGEALDVADAAFVKLFAFFDEWEWHLDERPLKSGREINPDVLGYIFEKFVNQKQMGAYYTKEDITDYIGKNTIIPCLLAKVHAEHPAAFDALAWPMLQQSSDAYIYPAMLKGSDAIYPPEIAVGFDTETPDLLVRRKFWNKRADDAVSLPTELWRETIARHQRTREVRAKIAAGELREVGDLITWNLDIRQFAQDLIEGCTDVALLKSFWFALAGRLPRTSDEKLRHGLSVLDPTCGSGAFLFAAMNILKPLYDATLRTLQAVRSDALIAGERSHPEKWAEVDDLLTRFAAAGSERAQDYAVIKHIIVNNLYGVDIEEQATEIAKLRLFLKLVALLEPGDEIEPLPDIDFNIRHGNTLVGYATAHETEKAVTGATQGNLFNDAWQDIRIRLVAVEKQYNDFQIQQVQRGGHVTPADKQALVDKLIALEEMLNYHMANEYGVNPNVTAKYETWKAKVQPFHWYVDFYPLMARGGFDVVIGNPPYVEYKDIKQIYTLKGFDTLACGDLYAFCTERSYRLLMPHGQIGLIVPISIFGTDGFESLQRLSLKSLDPIWVSSFANRPSQLFDGAQKRLSILIGCRSSVMKPRLYTSSYLRWKKPEFDNVFRSRVKYAPSHNNFKVFRSSLEKLGSQLEVDIFNQITSIPDSLAAAVVENTSHRVYYTRKFGYFLAFLNFVPDITEIRTGAKVLPSELKDIGFDSPEEVASVVAVLSSSTFFWFWNVLSDCRNVNKRDLLAFPFQPKRLSELLKESLGDLGCNYLAHLRATSRKMLKNGLHIETFDYSSCKLILDKIDTVLAKHYGLSDKQLDYIINYDIKYRTSQSLEGDYD